MIKNNLNIALPADIIAPESPNMLSVYLGVDFKLYGKKSDGSVVLVGDTGANPRDQVNYVLSDNILPVPFSPPMNFVFDFTLPVGNLAVIGLGFVSSPGDFTIDDGNPFTLTFTYQPDPASGLNASPSNSVVLSGAVIPAGQPIVTFCANMVSFIPVASVAHISVDAAAGTGNIIAGDIHAILYVLNLNNVTER